MDVSIVSTARCCEIVCTLISLSVSLITCHWRAANIVYANVIQNKSKVKIATTAFECLGSVMNRQKVVIERYGHSP